MAAYAYVYLHGFRSDIFTKKGVILKEHFANRGIDLHLLDVKGGKGHEDTTVTVGLETLDRHQRLNEKPMRLIGSSMGGLISAVYASRNPEKVDRVVFINPAVNLKETWRTITDEDDASAFDRWKTEGMMKFKAGVDQEEVNIPFTYVEDSLQYPSYPDVKCPSIVFIGTQDGIIPPKNGYVFQLEQEDPKLMRIIEIDDEHSFEKPETLERVKKEVDVFFE